MRGVFALGLALAVASCGLTTEQRDAASGVGDAAASAGNFAALEFPRLRDSVVAMNKIDVEIGGARTYRDLEKNFTSSIIVARVRAAEALKDYGILLKALVTDTNADQLREAANDFVTSVKVAANGRFSDDQFNAIGALVEQTGGWLIEYKKAKALEAIVPKAQPMVNRLCDLLIEDFTQTRLHLSQEAHATIINLRADVDIALATPGIPFDERAAAVNGAVLANEAEARLNLVGEQAVAILKSLKRADGELAQALEDRSYSSADLANLFDQIAQLTSAARALGGTPH